MYTFKFHTILGLLWIVFLQAPYVLAWNFEADSTSTTNTFNNPALFTSETFRQTFDEVPLVFILANQQGGDPSTILIQNISTTGFVYAQVEPDDNGAGGGSGNDGPHVSMAGIPYIAIEPGVHTLTDGTIIEAGYITTNRFQSRLLSGDSWETLSFRGNFAAAPTLIIQLQTMNNETALTTPGPYNPFPNPSHWMSAVVRNVTATTAQVAIERSEATLNTFTATENIGYLAIQSAYNGTFVDNVANTVELDSFISGNVLDGWSDGCDNVSFPNINSNQRIAIASKRTRNDTDGGWLRRCALANGSIGLTVDEDRAEDNERNHLNETASVLVFDRAFDAELEDIADISITKDDGNHSYTPGGTATYTIIVSNGGEADAKNVLVEDILPDGVSVNGNWTCTTSTTNDPCPLCTPRGLSSCIAGGAGGTGATGTGHINQSIDLPVGSSVTFSVPVNFSANMGDY